MFWGVIAVLADIVDKSIWFSNAYHKLTFYHRRIEQ